jgi:hypothetical protein
LHALGGRGNVWGLFIPRPRDNVLKNRFPSAVVTDLNTTYFKKAEYTLNMSIPPTKPVHKNIIDQLSMIPGTKWEWGRMASEFKQDNDFTFAMGPYSVVDRLLEIAMNDPSAASNFKILLNAIVDRLEFNGQAVERVVLKGGIKLRTKHAVLCAGSVHSAAILLRSGMNIASGSGRLTDHDIYRRGSSST